MQEMYERASEQESRERSFETKPLGDIDGAMLTTIVYAYAAAAVRS